MNQKGQKGFVNILVVVLVVVVAAVAGYFALVKEQILPTETNQLQEIGVPATLQTDDCKLISNSTFRSINQYEGGLAPNGTVEVRHWDITFQGNKFDWSYSDVVESGTHTCENNILQAKLFDRSIAARYDGRQEILTWNGVEYKRVPAGTDDTAGWKTYRNEKYGFELRYPPTWIILGQERNEGRDYQVLARVINPERAGKVDTDMPIEQFLVTRQKNITCGGVPRVPVEMFGRTIFHTDWTKGFGLIDYRSVCIPTRDWPTTISLSAFDEPSRAIMDQILSTFAFTGTTIQDKAADGSVSLKQTSSFSKPYPLSWEVGGAITLSIAGVSIGQMEAPSGEDIYGIAFDVEIEASAIKSCAQINLRRVIDETGAKELPLTRNYVSPSNGQTRVLEICLDPNSTHTIEVVFAVSELEKMWLFVFSGSHFTVERSETGQPRLELALQNETGFLILPPAKPFDPDPKDGISLPIVLIKKLDWANSANAKRYAIYLCGSCTPYDVTHSLKRVDLTTSEWVLESGTLARDTTYFWRVVVFGDQGQTAGPVWSFTTDL